MKTNKIITWGLVAALGLGMTSCGDFLNIEPKHFVSEDNFWNEKTDIDQMVTGVYTSLQNDGIIERCIMWGETRSDNVAGGLKYDGRINIYRVLKENLLSNNAYTTWINFYSVINKCNTIIEMAPVVSERDPVYTASDVRATQAEMACIRDLCYFYLVRAFKDVPYYTHAIRDESQAVSIAPTSGDSIVRCLITDLEGHVNNALKAYPKDKSSLYNSNRNRITQNAIYALLADLCLWDNQYQKTVNYAQKVIDAKVAEYREDYAQGISLSTGAPVLYQYSNNYYTGESYPLYPCFDAGNTFGNDFNAIFGGNQNSFESLFELAYTYDGSDANYLSNNAAGALYGNHLQKDGNDGKGFLAAVEALVNDVPQKSYRLFDHDKDCRFYTSMNADDEYTKGYIAKFVASSKTVSTVSGKQTPYIASYSARIYNNRNWIFYRLTDVMLMQAEALVEMGGDNLNSAGTDENGNPITVIDQNLMKAFSLVWSVNRRSIMTNSNTTDSPQALNVSNYQTKSMLRELVMKERRRELLFEGKRWFDIIRRCHREGNTAYARANVPSKISSGSSSTLFINYESLYWPYNRDEVRNNNLLNQKPFYGSDDDDDSYSKTN